MMNKYYDFLKKEINKFEGKFEKFILHVPSFFKLLCDLLEEDVSKEDKKNINTALAYFVVPNDVISEDLYGPIGYVDDVFVCSLVLKGLAKKYRIDLLNKLWIDDEDFEKVLEECYKKSLKILEEKGLVQQILDYCGLENE